MSPPTDEELIYEQEKSNYELITRNIDYYGEKYQRIFTINSALLGILFLVTTFIIDYLSNITDYSNTTRILLIVMLVLGCVTILFLFLSLWKFIPISKLQGYKSADYYKFFKKYHNNTTIPFIEALTIKINELNIENLEKIRELKWHYKNSLLFTNIGIIIFFIFILLSIIVFFSLSKVINI